MPRSSSLPIASLAAAALCSLASTSASSVPYLEERAAKTFSLVPAQSYQGANFFDGWNFEAISDPTHGLVNYTDRAFAEASGLVWVNPSGRAVMKVDAKTNLKSGQNRNSVRISSKVKWTSGQLVIIDVQKMPYGCAVWPAFWAVGDNWPKGGEIDIIEGVHNQANNQMTLHTDDGCTLASPMKGKATGKVLTTDCYAYRNYNVGCGVQDPSTSSYGQGLNDAGGAVFAANWDSTGMSVWRFARNKIPSDIKSSAPVPSSWGAPLARWDNAQCSMSKYFPGGQVLVFDITLCGDWAGATYSDAGCPGTCADRVKTGSNFGNARWEINYVKTFA